MVNHRGVLGVLYAEDFDAEAPAHQPAPQPTEAPEPVFGLAQLDAARQEGVAAGRQEAEHGLLAARLQTLTLIAKGLSEARAEAAVLAEDTAAAVSGCMLSSLMACLPALCASHGAAELRAMTRRVLPALVDERRVTIRANPHMLPMLQEEIACLDQELADIMVLIATDAIPPGDVRIAWQDGAAIRDAGLARAAVTDALAALGLLQKETADA